MATNKPLSTSCLLTYYTCMQSWVFWRRTTSGEGATPSYILYIRAFGAKFWEGNLTCKNDYKVMVFYM